MKKVFLFVVAVCAMVAQANAQESANNAATTPETPAVSFSEYDFNFGDIEYKGKAEHEFVFTNNTKEPIHVLNCHASCGCTTPVCSKEPVKPGETGIVKVRYNNTSIVSSFNKTVTVTWSPVDQSNPKMVRLSIRGNILPEKK